MITQQRAHKIMGEDYIGIADVPAGFDRKVELDAFERIPFSEELLRKKRGECILVADVGLSLNEVIQLFPNVPFFYGTNLGPIKSIDLPWADESGVPGWRLIRRQSNYEGCDEDSLFIGDRDSHYVWLAAGTVAYGMASYFCKNNSRLFNDRFLRTATLCGDWLFGYHRVCVKFTEEGIHVTDDNAVTPGCDMLAHLPDAEVCTVS